MKEQFLFVGILGRWQLPIVRGRGIHQALYPQLFLSSLLHFGENKILFDSPNTTFLGILKTHFKHMRGRWLVIKCVNLHSGAIGSIVSTLEVTA